MTPEVIEWMSNMKYTATFVGLGCLYRTTYGIMYASMYGSVTDGQVFGRTLEDEEMEEITSCKSDLTGDIVTWEDHKWDLKSPHGTSEIEVFNFDEDICSQPKHGLVLVPHKLTFRESLHTCEKLSGKMASYVDTSRFDKLTHFLSKRGHMSSQECSADEDSDGTRRTIKVYLAGSDMEKEGSWTTWYNKTIIQFLPWASNRPYNDGDRYNCMMLQSEMNNEGDPHFVTETAVVNDEVCTYTWIWR